MQKLIMNKFDVQVNDVQVYFLNLLIHSLDVFNLLITEFKLPILFC